MEDRLVDLRAIGTFGQISLTCFGVRPSGRFGNKLDKARKASGNLISVFIGASTFTNERLGLREKRR